MTLRGAGEALAARLPIEDGAQRRARPHVLRHVRRSAPRRRAVADARRRHALGRVEQDSGTVRASLPMPAPAKPLFARRARRGAAARHAAPDHRRPRAAPARPAVHAASACCPCSTTSARRSSGSRSRRPTLVDVRGGRARRCGRGCGSRGSAATTRSCAACRRRSSSELGFKPADQPLVDEAVRAAGGVPGGLPAKVDVPLQPDTARRRCAPLRSCEAMLEVIEANLEGTIADIDSEFLHDLRVSVRRSRAVQRELKRVFPPDELAHFRAEFRWLQQATGDVRDLDVHVLEFDVDARARGWPGTKLMRDDLDPLLARAARPAGHRRAGRWSERCAPSGRRRCCRGGARSSTGSRRRQRTSVRMRRGRSARSPASGSARCTGGW